VLEEEIDQHEATLRKLAIEKEVPVAVLAFLNNKARHRSWGRPADEGPPVQGATHYHLHLHGGKFRELDDAELARQIAQRRAELAADAESPKMIDITPAKT
jgi:hypothetical protein